MHRRPAPRAAFTLIELLVVVAIIALLIAMLLPGLGRAREQGKAVKCEANLHMLALANFLYADANRGWFPQWGYAHGGGEAAAPRAWLNTMEAEYGRNRGVLRCPSDRSRYWNVPFGEADPPRLRKTSFASNFYLSEADTPLRDRDGHPYNRLDWITRPAATIYFVELTEEGAFALSDHVHPEQWDFYIPQEKQFVATQMALERHLGKANYGMVDGHVERLAFEKTFSLDGPSSGDGHLIWFHNKYDPTVAR